VGGAIAINELLDHGSDANAGIVVAGSISLIAFSLIAGYGEQGVRECRAAHTTYEAQHPSGVYDTASVAPR
jgi:hypothetical protein